MRCDKHTYQQPPGGGYYKRDKDGGINSLGLPKIDQSVSYIMLYCPKCGNTKEVMVADHRAAELEK